MRHLWDMAHVAEGLNSLIGGHQSIQKELRKDLSPIEPLSK